MNFTREPIIETIITPKEGYKLLVRSSKGVEQEEYSVDALEIVSFGTAIFYRSSERPKPFLVPVSDFEVVEVKEARVILKNVNLERSIKISGGREATFRGAREPSQEKEEEPAQPSSQTTPEHHLDKKRDRRNRRRRRLGDRDQRPQQETSNQPAEEAEEGGGARDETQVSSPTFTTLIPPPQTLISQTISRYKDQGLSDRNTLPSQVEEPPVLEKKKEEPEEKDPGAEIKDLNRVSTSYSSQSTSFSIFPNDNFFI